MQKIRIVSCSAFRQFRDFKVIFSTGFCSLVIPFVCALPDYWKISEVVLTIWKSIRHYLPIKVKALFIFSASKWGFDFSRRVANSVSSVGCLPFLLECIRLKWNAVTLDGVVFHSVCCAYLWWFRLSDQTPPSGTAWIAA